VKSRVEKSGIEKFGFRGGVSGIVGGYKIRYQMLKGRGLEMGQRKV